MYRTPHEKCHAIDCKYFVVEKMSPFLVDQIQVVDEEQANRKNMGEALNFHKQFSI
jgi:hypothetical protein